MAAAPTLDAINRAGQAEFTGWFAHLFEHSPWVVEWAWSARPFADVNGLHGAFLGVLKNASEEDQLRLIRAHPDLAGKAALAGELTADSAREQSGAGLDRMSPEEFARFHRLNEAYRTKFGFPFLICVRLNDKASILAAFERRIKNDPAQEQRQALIEIGEITRLRLLDMKIGSGEALNRHTARVRHDLVCLDYPSRPWVKPREHQSGTPVHDVIIIGGGQSGLSAAFGLMREKVGNILVIDENPEGQEGPWVTYARMVTLRTPKYLTGPDLGVPSLTFRAWWEAQFGVDSWEGVGKVPKEEWMRYLRWFRATLDIPVRNQTRLDLLEPTEGGLFRLSVSGKGAPAGGTLLARKVVLATGIQGGGEWHVPGFVAKSLPPALYAHTSQAIDFAALKGRKIGILGGGASAFDNAQYALGQGVAEVHLFMRRKLLPRVNPIRFMENAGFLHHFADLDDAEKYKGVSFFLNHSQPPTNDTFNRAVAYPNFQLHLGAPWLKVEPGPEGVRVEAGDGTHDFAFVVVSTGLLTDVALRPELKLLAPDVALWRDRYTPPEGAANPLLDDHPYLGPSFEFTPKTPEAASRLHGLFAFNYSALGSLGLSASALSGMKYAVPRLVRGITRQLFVDDQKETLAAFLSYEEEEFVGQWPVR